MELPETGRSTRCVVYARVVVSGSARVVGFAGRSCCGVGNERRVLSVDEHGDGAQEHLLAAQYVIDGMCQELSGHHDAVFMRHYANELQAVRTGLEAFPTEPTVEAV